jgi:hypothetical protein
MKGLLDVLGQRRRFGLKAADVIIVEADAFVRRTDIQALSSVGCKMYPNINEDSQEDDQKHGSCPKRACNSSSRLRQI